jgi:hypothetical protein
VSHPILLNQGKRDRAILFGRELDKAMKRRGVGARPIIDVGGPSRSAIRSYRSGRNLPRVDTARRLADALEWPRLAELALELRTKTCPMDRRTFMDESGSDNRIYCSPECQRLAEKKRIGYDRGPTVAKLERHLRIHQDAVAAFCHDCEPNGVCVTVDCALRPVSPLPLGERRPEHVAQAIARPHNGFRDPGADSRRMSRVWDDYTPEQRQARIDKAADGRRRQLAEVRS